MIFEEKFFKNCLYPCRHLSGVFIVKFEHYFTPCSSVSTVNFEHAIAG